MQVETTTEHQWLAQHLIGEWTFESRVMTEAGKLSDERYHGNESVRALGKPWVLCEGQGDMPGGGIGHMLMTLGYDATTHRYVGSWIGSMMTHMWCYDGELDSARRVLTLSSVGPDFSTPGKTRNYRDVIEIHSSDYRTLRSFMQTDEGNWQQLMEADYHRARPE
ncbi:MAG: DUF1579 domain-containing protein [Rhodocyclaceae bacterium]